MITQPITTQQMCEFYKGYYAATQNLTTWIITLVVVFVVYDVAKWVITKILPEIKKRYFYKDKSIEKE